MDISKVLSDLRHELENLDAAIWTLERLQQAGPRKRGRPPKSVSAMANSQPERAPQEVPEKPVRTARRRP
jgi:hypothetical protein